MADFISGIKTVPPTYPVRPVQPGEKDRESGKRKKDRPAPEKRDESSNDNSKDPTTDPSTDPRDPSGDEPNAIDEYV